MSETSTEPKSLIDILIWMIVIQLLAVISLVIWHSVAASRFMFFAMDSGIGVLYLVILYYPIYPIGMIFSSWIAYSSRKISLAVILSFLSGAPTVLVYFIVIIDGVLDKLR